MKWIIPFLGLIFFSDMIAIYQYNYLHQTPLEINYVSQTGQMFFYYHLFYHLHNNSYLKKIIIYCRLCSLIGFILSYLLLDRIYTHMLHNTIINSIVITVLAFIYMYSLATLDGDIIMTRAPGFWISVGVILFFSTTAIGYIMVDFIRENDLRIFGARIYNFVPRLVSLILYSFITVSIVLYKSEVRNKSVYV
jgi:hypothetical protein